MHEKEAPPSRAISWLRVQYYLYLHLLAFMALPWLTHVKILTIVWNVWLIVLGYVSLTVGAHRLWAHRAFQTGATVRGVLALGHLLMGQGSVRSWALRHRRHHRYLGTARDPFDVSKGLFYTHFVSNVLSEPADEVAKSEEKHASDLDDDGVLWLTTGLHWPLLGAVSLAAVAAPVMLWGESWTASLYVCGALRLAVSAHVAWLVHSAWHIWGLAPGDRYPSDTPLVFVLTRSHWPRYHHAAPWDWRTGELGDYDSGISTAVLRALDSLKLVWGLRTLSVDQARRAAFRSASTGAPLQRCLDELQHNPTLTSALL